MLRENIFLFFNDTQASRESRKLHVPSEVHVRVARIKVVYVVDENRGKGGSSMPIYLPASDTGLLGRGQSAREQKTGWGMLPRCMG